MESSLNAIDPNLRLYDGDPFRANNPDQERVVVKLGSQFLVLDQNGFIPNNLPNSPYGLYKDDTRYLSTWTMFINGARLRLLSSNPHTGFEADLVYGNQRSANLEQQSVMVRRQIVIDRDVHEKITIRNYNPHAVSFEFAIAYGADHADIFEVRGTQRLKRGISAIPKVSQLRKPRAGQRIKLSYTGVDEKQMNTIIDLRSKAKIQLSADGLIRLPVHLKNGQEVEIEITFQSNLGRSRSRTRSFEEARNSAHSAFDDWNNKSATISTDNGEMNRLIEQAYRDLFILRQPVPGGSALAAGLPWFACAFGRDQAIAAMQTLPFFPKVSREIILNLAKYQGTKTDDYREEKPGKILHELRLGEMARNGETPFSPYYGTVDATPLWLMLFARYVNWSNDLTLARKLWKNVEAAIRFVESETASNGYLTYDGNDQKALVHQGWKDSPDSVMYSDGRLTKGSIALCEPQGYLYAAFKGIQDVAGQLGKDDFAAKLGKLARNLKRRFSKDFWMEEKDFPALALDGDKRQCDVVSSNPGHLVGTGILTEEQESRVITRLMQDDMFSRWGIRTLSTAEVGYNPMSYHNGSIWPHDNAMIVDGMCHSGHSTEAHKVLCALLTLAEQRDDGRLPELICGFASSLSEGPISYPISCTPQAWSAGAPLQILASCLGISFDAEQKKVTIANHSLPEWLGKVTVSNLRFGKLYLNLEYNSSGDKTTCTVLSKSPSLNVDVVQ